MSKRPTSADVAAMAGVSRTTVSFVLNHRADVKIPDGTRQRVVDAAAQLDYQPNAPARQLAGGRSHVLALVLHQSPEQVASDAVLAETLRGLSAAARAGGFRVMVELLAPDGPDASYASLLGAQHADGLIVSGPRSDDPSLLALVRDGFPVVLQGSFPDLAVVSVDVDNVAEAGVATRYLIDHGRKRIATIAGPQDMAAGLDRFEGWRRTLEAASLEADLYEVGDFTPPGGAAAMVRLLDRKLAFDAVFIASDQMAYGAMGALREHGISVPKDVAVVGFDNDYFSTTSTPPLTTVAQPSMALGSRMAEILVRLISGGTAERLTIMPTELVERESV